MVIYIGMILGYGAGIFTYLVVSIHLVSSLYKTPG